MAWTDIAAAADLAAKGKLVVRHDGRQILLMETPAGRFACVNRCPHEGYPLREGTLVGDSGTCVLTCQWHNWKFDLVSGETLVGGDQLTRFPIREAAGRIEIDIVPEDPAVKRRRILAGLTEALNDADDQRIVREAARWLKLGEDPADLLAHGFAWAHPRLEFGATHALGAAPDWLQLAETMPDEPGAQLVALGEILGHLADDARDRSLYPFAEGSCDWDEAGLAAAIEAQDEALAIRILRGGMAAGLSPDQWQRVLSRIALKHYGDFGHSLIYSIKTPELLHRLGPQAAAHLLESLVRGLGYATREDLIPEFRAYADCRANWGKETSDAPPLSAIRDSGSARALLHNVTAWSAQYQPEEIFAALLDAGAFQLLQADETLFFQTDNALADNTSWLDFTHTLTFANAGLQAVWDDPDLWPDLLLQIACFVGRNAGFVDPDLDTTPYSVNDIAAFWAAQRRALLDHGRGRFIISAHLVKTLLAAEQLAVSHPACAAQLAAALNRFLAASIKERHILRNARQMSALVAEE